MRVVCSQCRERGGACDVCGAWVDGGPLCSVCEVRLAVQAASSSLRAALSVLDTVERTLEGTNDDR